MTDRSFSVSGRRTVALLGCLLIPMSLACSGGPSGSDSHNGAGGNNNGGDGGGFAGDNGNGGGAGGDNENAGGSGGTNIAGSGGAPSSNGGSAQGGHAGVAGSGGTAGVAVGGSGGTATGGAGGGGDVVETTWPFDAAEAKRRQLASAAAHGFSSPEVDVDLGGGVTLTMVVVPPGMATLGSPPTETGHESDENQHTATFRKPFLIGKTLFTRAHYQAVMGAFPTQHAPCPSCDQAVPVLVMDTTSLLQPALEEYRKTKDTILPALQAHAPAGWTFRLPTNDEWEYAARAGTSTIFYSGDTEAGLRDIAWYRPNSGGHLRDVGLKLPNAWNLLDMMGNNWVWIFLPPPGTPPGLNSDTDPKTHLVRSCGVLNFAYGNQCRVANRYISTVPVAYRFVADIP